MEKQRIWMALGVLLLAALACSAPVAGNPTPTLPVTVTVPPVIETATTAVEPLPATQTPGVQVTSVRFYLVAIEDNGQSGSPVGCGDSLVAIEQPVDPTNEPIRAALERLFSYKTQYVGESGLYTALWQSNLQVQSAAVDAQGMATIELVGNYQLGGTCDTPRFQGQIEQTVLDAPGVESASILLNGVPIEQALSSQ